MRYLANLVPELIREQRTVNPPIAPSLQLPLLFLKASLRAAGYDTTATGEPASPSASRLLRNHAAGRRVTLPDVSQVDPPPLPLGLRNLSLAPEPANLALILKPALIVCPMTTRAPNLLACTARPGGSSGGRGESFGYRWITMQVRVRVTPSTTWMRAATSRPR
jgi:hypothetical protein